MELVGFVDVGFMIFVMETVMVVWGDIAEVMHDLNWNTMVDFAVIVQLADVTPAIWKEERAAPIEFENDVRGKLIYTYEPEGKLFLFLKVIV